MKVGDLVRSKRTGKVSLVTKIWWENKSTVLFTASGFAGNQVHDAKFWEVVSAKR